MDYRTLISRVKRFGATDEDLCARVLGITPSDIRDNVIITPGWGPEKVTGLGEAVPISSDAVLFESFKVWDIKNGDVGITYIKTGFGAPVVMDALLPLGLSKCKRILFISSTGALDKKMAIGDIVLPDYSVSGDGASRYIASEKLEDTFGEQFRPDAALLKQLQVETEKVCKENNVNWHKSRTFCTDTILTQYAHMDHILDSGCNTVDMESALAFRAAQMMNKPLAALLNVSDNTFADRSLIGERPQAEIDYRQFVRKELMPQIILNLFRQEQS